MKRPGIVVAAIGVVAATAAMAQQPAADLAASAPSPWTGAYAGVVGNYFEPGDRQIGGIGGVFGYNFAAGGIVIGTEIEAYQLFFDPASLNIVGRVLLGVPVGDAALIYGVLGYGGYFWENGDGRYAQIGAGAEFAVGRSLGLRGEILGLRYPDRSWAAQVDLGLVWHFRR